MKNVDVTTEVVITRPKHHVANFSGNPDNAPAWYVNIGSVEWETEPPLAVGSRMAFVAHFLGRRMEYTYEIVEFVPHERLVMRTSQGPFPMETSYKWEAIDEKSTLMTLRNTGRPTGFSIFMAPFMSRMMRRANRKDLILLKHLLERGSYLKS